MRSSVAVPADEVPVLPGVYRYSPAALLVRERWRLARGPFSFLAGLLGLVEIPAFDFHYPSRFTPLDAFEVATFARVERAGEELFAPLGGRLLGGWRERLAAGQVPPVFLWLDDEARSLGWFGEIGRGDETALGFLSFTDEGGFSTHNNPRFVDLDPGGLDIARWPGLAGASLYARHRERAREVRALDAEEVPALLHQHRDGTLERMIVRGLIKRIS